jgi:hypothetical protein
LLDSDHYCHLQHHRWQKQQAVRPTIIKGHHFCRWPHPALYFGRKELTRVVEFGPGCRYHLPRETEAPPDQWSINKLFGIGYLWSHHIDSARFGWRWDPEHERVELLGYCYVNGNREWKPVTLVKMNTRYKCTIRIWYNYYRFIVSTMEGENLADVHIAFSHKKKIGFYLNPYFGGPDPAPADVFIEIDKV